MDVELRAKLRRSGGDFVVISRELGVQLAELCECYRRAMGLLIISNDVRPDLREVMEDARTYAEQLKAALEAEIV